MLSELNHSQKAYLKMISENGGKLLYFLLASVFCYLASFALADISSAAQYIFLALSLAGAVGYCCKRKKFIRLNRNALAVFAVSQAFLLIICILGAFAGGAILSMMFILSLFISVIADKVYLKATKKHRMQNLKDSQNFEGKHSICIFNSTDTDIAVMLSEMLDSHLRSIVYDEKTPLELLNENEPDEDVCIFSSKIYSLQNTLETLYIAKPDVLIVIGAKEKPDEKLIKALTDCKNIYSDNDDIINKAGAKDIKNHEDIGLGLQDKENDIAAMCIEIYLSLGENSDAVKNNLIKLLG